jgi:hypothetical protein
MLLLQYTIIDTDTGNMHPLSAREAHLLLARGLLERRRNIPGVFLRLLPF